jgi:cobalt transporter subunit CbtA
VLVAALAGLVAGLFDTAAQAVRVTPLIYEAETYEQAAVAPHEHEDAVAPHAHEAAAWAPEDGAERIGYTALANVLTALGFGLLLTAAFALRGRADWRSGLLWGGAGFLTFTLAPALGLPPELPGSEAAALADRQLWWVLTVAATGVGLALLLLKRAVWAAALGVVLIVMPHVVGAPQPAAHGGLAPAALVQEFVVASILTSLLFWLVLGGSAGFLYGRFAARSAA